MSSKFQGKTKADLVAIARISGLLKTTVSQKMSKAELLDFLENADSEKVLEAEHTVQQKKSKNKPARRKPSHKPKQIPENPDAKADTKEHPTDHKPTTHTQRRRKTKSDRSHEADTSDREEAMVDDEPSEEEAKQEDRIKSGVLEIMPDGYGFIRIDNYSQGSGDLYLPPQYIRRFQLRTGDYISGPCRQQRDQDRYPALYYLKEVNGQSPDRMVNRPHFEQLTPIYPNERYNLETTAKDVSGRIINLVSPIGKGQRGMIVSPPKAGKTVLMKKIANAITANHPNSKLIVLLIDERPEEVTDMQRSIKGEVVYSTFDKSPENHVKITELVLERAKRMVELGEDVVILLDSITRMSRAYNLTINPTGRTLSGGLDPGALYGPKRFFGAARNIENLGSLTIIATALIETGSRMDEVIFEEFKGTGNMEVVLDRKLADKRIFPAIDMIKSGTRREDLLLTPRELDAAWSIRKAFSNLEPSTVTKSMISLMLKTKNNEQFVESINISLNEQKLFDGIKNNSHNSAGGPAGSASTR